MKAKIALCLSGKIRNAMFCFPYIYDNFIMNEYDVDVFIHTWDESRVIKIYNPKKFRIDSETNCLNFMLPQLYFNGFNITEYIPANGSTYKGIPIQGNIVNNVLMYYSIKKSFDLIDRDDYDAIIRCRFDLILQPKIDLYKIINSIKSNEYDIFIPNVGFNMGGYNDQFAIGNKKSMKIYSETIFNINSIVDSIKRWHPESFLGKQLNDNNINVYQEDIDYRIVRNVQIQTHWPENPFHFKNE